VLIVAPLLLVESGVWTEEMRTRFADDGRIFEPFVVLRDKGIRKVTHNAGGRDFLGKPILDPAKLMAHKVVITTYETMMAYQHSLAQLVGGRPLWSLVVFDEAQEVKAPKTKQSIAAKALDAQFKLAATGTPVETRLRDLWNLLDTVEPGRLGTQKEFVTGYERPAMNPGSQAERETALHALRAAIRYERPGALLIRRDKSILPDLPERIEHRVPCTMTPLEEETMGRIRTALGSPAGRRQPLAALQQLHLCTQHPVLAGASFSQHDVESLIATSARLSVLVQVLRDIEARGEKVLIFARSVDAQRLLARVISQALGIPVDIINGQTGVAGGRAASGKVRREILNRFRATPGFAAIVLSPFVAGVGLTLTEANHVIHYGRWWNPAIENQATDRAYRIGQTKPVHVYYLIGVHRERGQPSFDEVLDALLRERRELARDFLSPAPEEATAELLVQRLGSQGQPTHVPTPREPTTVAEVAAALLAEARARGDSAAWLGEDGMYGVHLLMLGPSGLRAMRIVVRDNDSEQRILASGQKAWRDALGFGTVEGSLVAKEAGTGASTRTWAATAGTVARAGERYPDEAFLLSPLRRVEDIRAALSENG
jgi:superfamily II DNA or RNA helicase